MLGAWNLFVYNYIITTNRINRNMQKIFSIAKELLFPKRCFFCSAYGAFLCADCQSLMDIAPVHRRDKTKKYLSDIYSPCSYENPRVKKIIHAFKYEPFCRELALPLAEIISGHFSLCGQNPKGFNLVFVPLANKRMRGRGFNQARDLAEKLSAIWQIPLVNSLIKIKETACQAELSQCQRIKNLRDAFVCENKKAVAGKKIFLIDDVVTTGATMEECAKVLRFAGAKEVVGICIARTHGVAMS